MNKQLAYVSTYIAHIYAYKKIVDIRIQALHHRNIELQKHL